ncbi:MAG: tRNA-dihydrouridine synthase family protein [Desulfobacterales bacterium]
MVTELSKILNRPLKIGGKFIQNRLVFAPMSMLGNVAFRELLSIFGGYGLLFSEMCNAARIPKENPKNSVCFRWRQQEKSHLVFQIFGSDPHTMAHAAKIIDHEGFFGVDINFGCSVHRICRQNCGAAILKNPDLAEKIVLFIRKAISIPLFVKFRTGWKDDPAFAVNLAKRFEGAGADALTFHPRVSPDRRSRHPKWEYIGLVKNAVSIPVFGNGNVFDSSDCLKMLKTTGCNGVAIGRLAVAKPWVFSQFADNFTPDNQIYVQTAISLTELIEKHFDPLTGLRRFKKFALYFSGNFPFGNTLYSQIKNASHMDDIRSLIKAFLKNPITPCSRPNMNFLI